MGKYRKKSIVVEAVQFTGPKSVEEIRRAGLPVNVITRGGEAWLEVVTLEGTTKASAGDWIVTGAKGEIYPCKPDVFEATYDPAE